MTDPEYVHYLILVDRSGSMQSIRPDTEGGLRAFIDAQLEGVDGNKRTVSLYQFDTVHDCVHDFDLLEKAKTYQLVPRGGTALLDACGYAITKVGAKLAAMEEDRRPGHVIVVIATDGEENSSKEYTKAQVKKMIEHQTNVYKWKFTYIGANQDAFAEARSIGIPASAALYYSASSTGTAGAWRGVATASSASTAPTCDAFIGYTAEQRNAAR